jgi:LPPG:FO 2-phospho-L-lactate transferase
MSDNPVPTIVISDQGELSFQDYFVKLKCEPQVKGFEYLGVEKAEPAPGVLESIDMADFVIICPSNPWVSIGPILAVPGILEAIQRKPVLAVSPIIRGKAVKGPAAKMYREMGFTPSALAVAEGYSEMLDGFILDSQDQDLIPVLRKSSAGKYRVFDADTWMETRSDRVRFAKRVIEFGRIILQEA